jgi:hypothetical protein
MAEKFEVDQIVSILKNDSDLNTEFKNLGYTLIPQYTSGDTAPKFTGDTYIGSYYLTITGYSALAEYYLANINTFTANTAVYLSGNTTITSALWNIIINPISTPYGYFTPSGGFTDSILAHWLAYSFKYSAVKTFFRQKYKYFLPEFDYDMINSEEKTKLYQEAFMREFDKFTMVIDNLYNIVDLDKIPTEYLNYLAQIIGYERDDYQLLTNSSFRELLKNIIEIYRIKGTNYSFELFFNLLGFEIIPKEFWFDRRFGDTSISANAYTASTNKDSYLFYLTPNKPTDAIPTGMSRTYSVSKDSITEPMDLNAFDRLASTYTTGDSNGYSSYHLTGNVIINPSHGLQGHWNFNEGIGDTVLDLSTNRNRMTLYNTEWTRSGYSSTPQVYFADKLANRYVKSIIDPDYRFGVKELTFTFWATKLAGDSCVAFTFGRFNTDGFCVWANTDGSGIIRLNTNSSHEDIDIPEGTFDNKLRFYALTFNSNTKKVVFYKNSVIVVNETATITTTFPTGYVYLGNYSIPIKAYNWVGSLEEARLYTRELSAYEIKHLFAPLGDTYTYFKTNVIQYSITSLGTGQEADLSAADLDAIEFYAKFLSPIFVERNILFSARPSIETAKYAWTLLDEPRADPIYMNRTGPLQSFYNRSYAIQSIDARAGDTFCPRGKIIVNNISSGSAKTTLMELLNPTGDSLVGKFVIDRITIAGTGSVANDGTYYLSADTVSPAYNPSTRQVTIYLKGDTNVGMHGSSKASPSGTLYIGGPDRMMHLYSGYYPDRRYWEGNLFESSRTIPGGSELIRLDDTKNRTSDDKIATRNSDLIFEWPTYGTTINDRVRWAGKGVTGFWGPIVNKVATENVADTSKWNRWPALNSNIKKVYDATMGDFVYSWSPGTSILKAAIGDSNQSPGDTGKYYTSMWIRTTKEIKVTPFFSNPNPGDTLFGDTVIITTGGWTFVTPTITTNNVYNGFGWLVSGYTTTLTSGDTFRVYNVQVEKNANFARPFAKPSLRGGDSLAYPLTVGDSGAFECWVRPYFNYNTTADKFVMSDYTGDSVHIVLKYSQATDKWLFSIMKDASNYRNVSCTTAYTSDASLRQWIHLKATWNVLANYAELYVNGTVQHGDSTYAGTANTWAKNSFLSIGSTPYIATNYVFEGLITDALLYNTRSTNNFHWGDSSYWTVPARLGKTGHWISGDHTDTRESYTAPEVSSSVFSKIKLANPTWNDEQIYEYMRVLIKTPGDSGLSAQNWNLRRRDMFLLVDAVRYLKPGYYSYLRNRADTYASYPTGDSWVRYYRKSAANYTAIAWYGDSKIGDSKVYWRNGAWINAVPNPVEEVIGNFITLGANHPLRTWDIRPQEKYYVDFNITANADTTWGYNTGQVFYIDADNGSGQGVIRVLDHRRFVNNGDTLAVGDSIRKFSRLVKDDYVTLFDTKHGVNNVTRMVDAVTWYGDTTEITVKPPISAIDQINLFKGYLDFEQVRRIKSYSTDAGAPTFSRVVVYDGSQVFTGLRKGDTLQIINTGDSTEGTYYADSVGHARIAGDSGLTTIILSPVLPGGYGDSDKGAMRLNGGSWTLNEPKYKFMFDKFQMTETRKG